jgi:sporulation protein YlmC with PRC-barrel domain
MGMLSDTPTDTDNTAGQLIAASKVNGTSVYDASGNKLGSIYDVMLDKTSGQASYAIMSFGGFLGIGEKYHPLPWSQLHYDVGLGGYVVDIDRDVLEGGPAYDTGDASMWDDRGWGSRVDDYYGGPLDSDIAGRRGTVTAPIL